MINFKNTQSRSKNTNNFSKDAHKPIKSKRIPLYLKIILIVITILIVLIMAFFIYCSFSYKPDNTALNCINENNVEISKVDITKDSYENLIFDPGNATTGFIFYPGGKVDYESYAPLIKKISQNGYLCIIAKMPFNLAFLNTNAADNIIQEYSNINNWYIGGHSLGATFSAKYASSHQDKCKGIIMLASYSVDDLTNKNLKNLNIYATEDKVCNKDNVEKNKHNLPSDKQTNTIIGGCHSYFGNYGIQDGDGCPSISQEEQQNQTTSTIVNWIHDQQQ